MKDALANIQRGRVLRKKPLGMKSPLGLGKALGASRPMPKMPAQLFDRTGKKLR